MIPIFGTNGHKKCGFEWSTFGLKLKRFYSKVGGNAPEYVRMWLKPHAHEIGRRYATYYPKLH